MKRIAYSCLLTIFFSFSKINAQSSIIGTPIKIGNIEVAQYDFPNRMKWNDANRTCLNLGQGWRLPTKDEIQILYNNKNQIGNLQDPYLAYWSSTEIDNNIAWYGVMKDGFTRNTEKFYESGVRAVRTVTDNSAFSQTNTELEKKQLNPTNNKPNDDLNSKITDFNRQIGSAEIVKSKYKVGAYINENEIIERIGLGGIYWGIKINGKWGITNTQRVLQVPIIYDDIKPNYVGDIFRVVYNGKYGYINPRGNFIIPPLYDEISLFLSSTRYDTDKSQWVPSHLNSDITAYRVGDKWGYVDINGKLITDAIFSDAYSFVSNVAPVKKDGKWGLINRSGFPIIPIIFKDIQSRYLISGFNAIAFTNEKNQVGVYNISGDLIMPFTNGEITLSGYVLGSSSTGDDIPPFIKVSGKIQLVKNIDRLVPDYGLLISEDTKTSPGFKNTFLGKYYYSVIGKDYSSSSDKSSKVNSDINPSSSNLSNDCKSNLQLCYNSFEKALKIIKKAENNYSNFDVNTFVDEQARMLKLFDKIKGCPKFNSSEEKVYQKILKNADEIVILLEELELQVRRKNKISSGINSKPSFKSSEKRWNYICEDCNKVKVLDSEPFDNSTCPDTRWGGVGKAPFADGKHSYRKIAQFGTNPYSCSTCGLSISTDGKKFNMSGHCAATGNMRSHNWEN
jgi:hypothetical protein